MLNWPHCTAQPRSVRSLSEKSTLHNVWGKTILETLAHSANVLVELKINPARCNAKRRGGMSECVFEKKKRHICLFAFCLRALKPGAKAWPRYTKAYSQRSNILLHTHLPYRSQPNPQHLGTSPKSITKTKRAVFLSRVSTKDNPKWKTSDDFSRWHGSTSA